MTAARERPVNVAVVGLGYWGPNLVRNFVELSSANVVAVCDRRAEAFTTVARRFPSVRTTTSYEDLLAADDIEAIVLATPVATHYDLAMSALESGKHTFVEKPLAASLTEAVELVRLAERSGLVLMPGHTFLYSPPVNLIADLIAGGDLGDIYFVSTSRVNLGIHQSDVGVVWDLGPHDFSILRHWLGEMPDAVAAFSRSCIIPGTTDVAFINLQYPSGTVAHAEMSWLAPSKLRRMTVVGSRKMVVYDDTSNEPVRIFDTGVMPRDPATFGEFRLTYRAGDIVSPPVDATEPLAIQLADFCRAIREGVEPRSSARLGLDVIAMIEAVDASLAAGGVVVEVPTSRLARGA